MNRPDPFTELSLAEEFLEKLDSLSADIYVPGAADTSGNLDITSVHIDSINLNYAEPIIAEFKKYIPKVLVYPIELNYDEDSDHFIIYFYWISNEDRLGYDF